MIKAREMSKEVINHTFCSWCDYRRMVASNTYWGCGLDESKLDERCPYRLAVKREEQEEAGRSA